MSRPPDGPLTSALRVQGRDVGVVERLLGCTTIAAFDADVTRRPQGDVARAPQGVVVRGVNAGADEGEGIADTLDDAEGVGRPSRRHRDSRFLL
jgi:hypothetical protein